MSHSYRIILTDPKTGKRYRVKVWADVPKQTITLGKWEVTIARVVRRNVGGENALTADKITWEHK